MDAYYDKVGNQVLIPVLVVAHHGHDPKHPISATVKNVSFSTPSSDIVKETVAPLYKSTCLAVIFSGSGSLELVLSRLLPHSMVRGELRKAGYTLQPSEAAIGALQSDNAKEIIRGDFKRLCETLQISQRRCAAYCHENMALVERLRGVIFSMVRPFLHHAGFPKCLWPYVCSTAFHICEEQAAFQNKAWTL